MGFGFRFLGLGFRAMGRGNLQGAQGSKAGRMSAQDVRAALSVGSRGTGFKSLQLPCRSLLVAGLSAALHQGRAVSSC